jgi:hypothetical protein
MTLSAFLALLALTVGLGVMISIAIVAVVRRRWDEQDYRREMRNARHGGSRYGVR